MDLGRAPVIADYAETIKKRFGADRPASAPGMNESDRPLVSVVTVTYNAEAGLARAIKSVIGQAVPGRMEYIIVDGGSTDGTVDVIRSFGDAITYWISEPDRGISDAFNKGLALTTGKYVAIVNADDWLSDGQLSAGIAALEETSAGFCFGDLNYYSETGLTHRIVGDPAYERTIGKVMPAVNHPTVLVRRDLYEKCGLFRLNYRRAMDYDLILRFVAAGHAGIYRSEICGNMSLGGVSDNTWKKGLVEVRQIAISFGRSPLLAWSEFWFRLLKGGVRRWLDASPIGNELRRRVNRSYRPL